MMIPSSNGDFINGTTTTRPPQRSQRRGGGSSSSKRFTLPWRGTKMIKFVLGFLTAIWLLVAIYCWNGIMMIARGRHGGFQHHNGMDEVHWKRLVSIAQPCKYNGNCPSHTVCEDGLCLPYFSKFIEPIKESRFRNGEFHINLEECGKTCFNELKIDEHWFFEATAKHLNTYPALNGHGCVIDFERDYSPEAKVGVDEKEFGEVEDWMQGRFRHVVRVDPVDTPKSSMKSIWRALCDIPCTKPTVSDSDASDECPRGTICAGRPIHDVPTPKIEAGPYTCQKVSTKQSLFSSRDDFVVVSGANSAYFAKMRHMAASLQYWAPKKKLVVYNLGLKPAEVQEASTWGNVIEVKWPDGIPKSYPPHVHEGKKYAWKPIAINETLVQYKSIFWWDAGSTFTGPLWPIEEILHRHGIFLVHGQDSDMKPKSHPETYKYFGFEKDEFRKGLSTPHCGGGTQGHVYPSRYYDTIVRPWAECALDAACIAPQGSGLSNHRYDQTAISILAYQEHVQAPHHTEYVAAGRAQLNSDLKQPSHRMILWTSRGSCHSYGEPTLKTEMNNTKEENDVVAA